jgi:hypothetical protein
MKAHMPRMAALTRASLLIFFLGVSAMTWGAPGRSTGGYHPSPVYQRPDVNHPRPEQREQHSPGNTSESTERNWTRNTSTSAAERPVDSAEVKAQKKNYWESITASYGKATTTMAEAYLFLQIFNGHIYLTTNYLPVGAAEAPVTFLKVSDLSNPARIEAETMALFGRNIKTDGAKFKILLDKSTDSPEFAQIFNHTEQSLRINTSLFRHAELYLNGNSTAIPLVRIDRPSPPPRWAAKLNECCVRTGIPPDWIGWARLGSIPFRRDKAQIVSLFADTETGAQLGSIDPSRNVRMPAEVSNDPIGALKAMLSAGDSTAPLIVIGHVEEGAFKVEGVGGFSVPLESIVTLAREAGRPVVLLGCYTQDHMLARSKRKDYAGTLNSLYPRDVVPHLLRTMERATNLRDFTEMLSNSNMQIYISEGFIQAATKNPGVQTADLYKPTNTGTRSIVGVFKLFLPCAMFGGCK